MPSETHPIRLRPIVFSTFFVEIALLVTMFCLVGYWVVPAHYTTTYTDMEFTGWVAPIANRLADGSQLYADGLHSPMPPIPAVFLHLVSGGHAVWLTESLWVYVFQCLTILAIYIALSLVLSRPVPWLSALCTFPLFLALHKTILYDPIAQFLVAMLLVGCAWIIRRTNAVGSTAIATDRWSTSRVGPPAFLGFASAVLLLTKQSTAAGAVFGVGLFLACFPLEGRLRARVQGLAVYAVASAASVALLILLLLPYVSFRGLIEDVYLTGSEPKGGSELAFGYLPNYASEIFDWFVKSVKSVIIAIPAIALLVTLPARPDSIRVEPAPGKRNLTEALALGYVLASIGGSLLSFSFRGVVPESSMAGFLYGAGQTRDGLHTTALVSLVILAPIVLFAPKRFEASTLALAGLFLVAFMSAIGHSLSRHVFIWLYDNNPLISVVIACVCYSGIQLVSSIRAHSWIKHALGLLLFGAFIPLTAWFAATPKFDRVRECTETTDAVPHLRGAKFRPEMRALLQVAEAARWAAGNDGTVLMLPGDPNVEAWIDRPRPGLTSAITFVDQYWDKYVNEDFARLQNDPPKVILIGPANAMWIQKMYGHEDGSGANRLLELVVEEIIPANYDHALGFAIPIYGRDPTRMDIYVRKTL